MKAVTIMQVKRNKKLHVGGSCIQFHFSKTRPTFTDDTVYLQIKYINFFTCSDRENGSFKNFIYNMIPDTSSYSLSTATIKTNKFYTYHAIATTTYVQ